MTRNPDRIDEFLDAFAQEWKEHPDMRFGQLVYLLTRDDRLPGIEDYELIDRLDGDNPWGP